MTRKIGAHLSINGGFEKALYKTIEIGGTALQIFSSSPRGWHTKQVDDTIALSFKEAKTKLSIDPVYFHASYLVNLADEGRIGNASKKALITELTNASLMGVKGSIIHLGSYKGEKNETRSKTLITNIKEILSNTPPETLFIIENAGNKKIGQTLDEIKEIVTKLNNPRVKVCLDTCHLFSAGYDLRTNSLLDSFIQEFDLTIGLEKLELWHMNDSRDPYASFRDRHENIGKGTIGLDEFRHIINHKKLFHLPFIIETPGFDKKGPDKQNINILKSLIEQ